MTSLAASVGAALVSLGRADPGLTVLDALPAEDGWSAEFAREFPDRHSRPSRAGPGIVRAAIEASGDGRPALALASALAIAVRGYPDLREAAERRRPLRLLADPRASEEVDAPPAGPIVDDLGVTRGLPGTTVVVPSGPATLLLALRAVAGEAGPVYVRLPPATDPPGVEPTFELGRAAELRPGRDLTIAAIGGAVPGALEGAEELARVGISARVLDVASVKPIDEKALLRAARETGAILTMEEHGALTGLGAAVAAVVSEEHPVPVRRLGAPDVLADRAASGRRSDPFGLSREHLLEAAYELLRARGKVQ